MRCCVLMLLLLNFFSSYGNKQLWADHSLQQLDQEQFRRLETGKENPEEIAQLIVRKSDGKKSIYLVNAYTVFGIINKNKGFYVSALNYYLKALSVSEQLNDQGRISASLNNIGIIYVLQENYSKAIEYFNKSLQLEEKRKDPLQKSIRYFNLGDCYKALRQYDEAIGFYTNSLLIEKREQSKLGELYAQLGLAEVYTHTGRTSDAERSLAAAAFLLDHADLEATALFYKLKGTFFSAEKNSAEAEKWLLKAQRFCNEHQLKNELLAIYLQLSQLYEEEDQYQKALDYCKRHLELNNQLKSNFVKNQLEDLTYQHAIQRKELEISVLKEERGLARKNAKAMKDLRRFDWRISFFSVFALFALITAVVLGIRKMIQVKA